MKKDKRIKALLCVILLLFLTLIPTSKVSAEKNYDFDVTVQYGYSQTLLIGYSAPFTINAKNIGKDNFEGYIQMIVPGFSNNNILYEEMITLGANETKSIDLVAGIPVNAEFVNIRMVNKRGKVVWSELNKITCARNKNDIRVGVLTDDFSALSYIDRTTFISDNSKYLSLIELTVDSFPTDYYALEMFDCIMITDFPTDLLTKEQIDALRLWVQKGGFLIIGTGSTANKTLSGLKGTITNDNVTSSVSRDTALGINDIDYSYIQQITTANSSGLKYQADYFYVNNYYYYEPYDYAYEPWTDNDGDGYNDYVFDFGGKYDDAGDYYDAYGYYVDPTYEYLFEDDAFYENSNGEYHYKYYDERYGQIDEYDSDYQSMYDDAVKYDYLDSNAYKEYCNLWGFDPKWYIYEVWGIQDADDIESTFKTYFGSDYEEYCRHFMYDYYLYTYYGIDNRPDMAKPAASTVVSDFDSIIVDCAQIDESDATIQDEIIYGDSTEGDYVLARITDVGDGKIAICAVDFTKNPLPKTPNANSFVRNLVESTVGNKLINKCFGYESNFSNNNYGYYAGPDYSLKNLLKSVSSAPVPPIILYAGIMLLYFIAILVLFIVMSKKGKTQALWKIYPLTALGVAIVIFCLGFSTRVLRLNINAVTLIFPDKYVTEETNYVSAVLPKAKDYVVDFSDEVEIDRNFFGSLDYGYFYSSDVDYDTYTIAYRSDYNHFQSVITNKVALEKQDFKAEAAYNTQGGLEVTFINDPLGKSGTGAKNIKVTNNYSTTMEDVMVQVYNSKDGYMEYYFKKLNPNESVVASDGKHYDPSHYSSGSYSYSYYKYNYLDKGFQNGNAGKIMMGFLFGDLSNGFSKYVKRSSVIRYCMSEYEPDSDHVLVVAFPKTDICAKLVEGKKYKVNRTEAIIILKDFTDMEIK